MSRLIVMLLLLPVPALASGGGEAEGSSFGWEIANLVLLVAVLVYFGRKPVGSYLAERRGGIQENLASSQQLLDDAEGRLAEWSAKAAQLDQEVERIKEIARHSAEQERERILAEAERSAEAMRRTAKGAIDRELRRAEQVLRDEAADLAVELAEKLLKEQVSDADRTRLVDEFVTRIEQGAGGQS